MAVFFPYLYDDHGDFPEQDAIVYRVASFVGAIGSEQLIPGPLLDTGEINDVHEVLMFVGIKYEEMEQVPFDDGRSRRFGWIGFDHVLSITPEIVFALNEVAAREFLLDLRRAVEMLKLVRQNDHGACMIEVISPSDP